MKHLPFVSILVATFNDELTITLVLESIRKSILHYEANGGKAEIVIINDGSSDSTEATISSWMQGGKFPYVHYIYQSNQGVTKALRNGFQRTNENSKFIIRIDADAFLLQENWIYKLVEFCETDEAIGGVGVTVVNPLGKIEMQGINFFDDKDKSIIQFLKSGEYFIDETLSSTPIEVDAFLGTCALIRKENWKIDEYYRLWTEDVDQAMMIRLQGKKNFILPEIILFHLSYGFGRNKRDVGTDPELLHSRTNLLRISVSSFFMAIIGQKKWTWITDVFKHLNIIKPNPIRTKTATLHENNIYFFSKWGFGENDGDLQSVKERYRGTELCWRWDKKCQRLTKKILATYAARMTRKRR
ncbi:MAG: glycosyltransferase family 2 protein [Bacteroidota bacterium]